MWSIAIENATKWLPRSRFTFHIISFQSIGRNHKFFRRWKMCVLFIFFHFFSIHTVFCFDSDYLIIVCHLNVIVCSTFQMLIRTLNVKPTEKQSNHQTIETCTSIHWTVFFLLGRFFFSFIFKRIFFGSVSLTFSKCLTHENLNQFK